MLLATHAEFKFSWLSSEAHSLRDKSYGEADHGYDTQRDPWHRHSPNAKRAAGPHQYKNFSEFRTRLPHTATRRCVYTNVTPLTYKLLYNLLSRSCTMLYNCFWLHGHGGWILIRKKK